MSGASRVLGPLMCALALLSESIYAGRPGYTAPLYKLTPHIEETIKNAEGRVFISIFSNVSNLFSRSTLSLINELNSPYAEIAFPVYNW